MQTSDSWKRQITTSFLEMQNNKVNAKVGLILSAFACDQAGVSWSTSHTGNPEIFDLTAKLLGMEDTRNAPAIFVPMIGSDARPLSSAWGWFSEVQPGELSHSILFDDKVQDAYVRRWAPQDLPTAIGPETIKVVDQQKALWWPVINRTGVIDRTAIDEWNPRFLPAVRASLIAFIPVNIPDGNRVPTLVRFLAQTNQDILGAGYRAAAGETAARQTAQQEVQPVIEDAGAVLQTVAQADPRKVIKSIEDETGLKKRQLVYIATGVGLLALLAYLKK